MPHFLVAGGGRSNTGIQHNRLPIGLVVTGGVPPVRPATVGDGPRYHHQASPPDIPGSSLIRPAAAAACVASGPPNHAPAPDSPPRQAHG
jgi:hypothetical protein